MLLLVRPPLRCAARVTFTSTPCRVLHESAKKYIQPLSLTTTPRPLTALQRRPPPPSTHLSTILQTSTATLHLLHPRHQTHHPTRALTTTQRPSTTAPLPGPNPTPPTTLPPYSPPTTGLISHLPAALIPFAELSRLDKPAGTIYLFMPCLFSTLLAAPLTNPLTTPLHLLTTTTLFLLGALVMRGAGCTVNDLWDRNLDPHVTRTRHRPIARRAVSVPGGVAHAALQTLAGLAILLQFPQPACLYYGAPSLLLVATYPLAKRVTHYPQFVLGLTFSWGAIMGFPALGLDLLAAENAHVLAAAGLLYASCVAWTVLYDMIYAHMDIRDDARAGIKSIALRHEENTKAVLTALMVVQVGLLAGAGVAVGAGPAFFVGSCGGAVATLGTMIWRVDLKSVGDCWWWFRNGCWFTGGAIASGMAVEYALAGWAVW